MIKLTTLTPEQNIQVAYRRFILRQKQDHISHTIWRDGTKKAYAWINTGRVTEACKAIEIAANNPKGVRLIEKELPIKRGRGRPSTAKAIPAPLPPVTMDIPLDTVRD